MLELKSFFKYFVQDSLKIFFLVFISFKMQGNSKNHHPYGITNPSTRHLKEAEKILF